MRVSRSQGGCIQRPSFQCICPQTTLQCLWGHAIPVFWRDGRMPFIVGTNKFVFGPSFFAVVTSVLPGPGAAAVAKAKIRPLIGFSFFWHLICVLCRGHPHVFPVSNHPEPLPCMVWLGKRVTQLNFFCAQIGTKLLLDLLGNAQTHVIGTIIPAKPADPNLVFLNGESGFPIVPRVFWFCQSVEMGFQKSPPGSQTNCPC